MMVPDERRGTVADLVLERLSAVAGQDSLGLFQFVHTDEGLEGEVGVDVDNQSSLAV